MTFHISQNGSSYFIKKISEKIWLKNCSVFLDVYICDRMEGFGSTGGLLIVQKNGSIFFWITVLREELGELLNKKYIPTVGNFSH